MNGVMNIQLVDIDKYQEFTKTTDIYPKNEFNLGYKALGLTGEAGEVADKIKKFYRGDKPLDEEYKKEIVKELGDVLWYIAAITTELDINMSEVVMANVVKLSERKANGNIQGNGDNR